MAEAVTLAAATMSSSDSVSPLTDSTAIWPSTLANGASGAVTTV